ncbi:MAG: hypothetical protein KDA86_09705 [Planctomycetaceae bacterium]|nr:hypothetical protein [Planctomycetaceae bacterium]
MSGESFRSKLRDRTLLAFVLLFSVGALLWYCWTLRTHDPRLVGTWTITSDEVMVTPVRTVQFQSDGIMLVGTREQGSLDRYRWYVSGDKLVLKEIGFGPEQPFFRRVETVVEESIGRRASGLEIYRISTLDKQSCVLEHQRTKTPFRPWHIDLSRDLSDDE